MTNDITSRRGFGFLSPPDRTLLQSYSFFRCIIQSRWWRPWWLHLLWLWWCHLLLPHLLGRWAWLRQCRFLFHKFFKLSIFLPFIPQGLVPLTSGWSMSPPRAVLLRLLISSITIEIITYLFSRELEVDLFRSDVDDRVGGVEERSS